MKTMPIDSHLEPWPDPAAWSAEQAARAEAIVLANLVLPEGRPAHLISIARYVCTGNIPMSAGLQ